MAWVSCSFKQQCKANEFIYLHYIGFEKDFHGIEMIYPWFYALFGIVLCFSVVTAYFQSRRQRAEHMAWRDWEVARSLEGVDNSCYSRASFDQLKKHREGRSGPTNVNKDNASKYYEQIFLF